VKTCWAFLDWCVAENSLAKTTRGKWLQTQQQKLLQNVGAFSAHNKLSKEQFFVYKRSDLRKLCVLFSLFSALTYTIIIMLHVAMCYGARYFNHISSSSFFVVFCSFCLCFSCRCGKQPKQISPPQSWFNIAKKAIIIWCDASIWLQSCIHLRATFHKTK